MHDANQEALPADSLPVAPRPDLRFWLFSIGVIGLGALVLRQAELSAFAMLAGLFAVTHAADLDVSRRYLDVALGWLVPVIGALVFVSLVLGLVSPDTPPATRALGLVFAGIGIVVALASLAPAVADSLARALFRTPLPSLTERLAARLSVLGILLYPVAALAFPRILDSMAEQGGSLVGRDSLWGNVVGLTLLALGGVGFGVRRNLIETLERLGLKPVAPSHWLVAGLGVLAVVLLNAGAEGLQHRFFPALWASDQRVNQIIAGGLTRWDALLLGLSAGIGEEISLRGALQPRLGTFMTALVFAGLHVQYSWFGVLTILLLGCVLGSIRRRTSTTVAMMVHALYDIFAVITLKP